MLCSIVVNEEGNNNLVGVCSRVKALEATYEKFQEDQCEKMQKIQVAMTRLSVNGDNRRPSHIRGCAGGLAQGVPLARPNHRVDLPMRRQGDCEEYHVKANIPPFNENFSIKELLLLD